jgi:hypothetical protein
LFGVARDWSADAAIGEARTGDAIRVEHVASIDYHASPNE